MIDHAPLYPPDPSRIIFRENVTDNDIAEVRGIVASTGFFSEQEIEIAAELVEERLAKGIRSGYYFLFAEYSGKVLGYSCFGPIPLTKSSYDLYWIVLHEKFRNFRIGKEILTRSEEIITGMGGLNIYADTSSREQYAPTRSFYEKNGYSLAAYLPDFYSTGDGKIIYCKTIVDAGLCSG